MKQGALSNDFITVFSDASFCPYTGATGYACWIKYGNGKTIVASGSGVTKNSTNAELLGLRKALNQLLLKGVETEGRILVLQCDNVSALGKVDVPDMGFSHIKRKHIKGHSSKFGTRSYVQRLCDRLAYKEMRKQRAVLQS